jgi:hypothetical protein
MLAQSFATCPRYYWSWLSASDLWSAPTAKRMGSSLGACGQADGVLTRYPHLLVENRGGGTFAAFAPAPFGFCSCRWKPIWERRLANSRRRKDGGRSTFAAVGLGDSLPACPNSAGGLHVHLSSGPSPGARFFSRGWRVATDTKAPDTEGSWGIVQR